jgi:hypothetical protein
MVVFPSKFPDIRELLGETGSQLTASTTIQSDRTTGFQENSK